MSTNSENFLPQETSCFFSRRSQKVKFALANHIKFHDMKSQIIKFRVTKIEQKIIQRKADRAGISVSEFLRRLAFEKEFKSRLSDDELECYKTLSKYADNFRRISNLLNWVM